MLGLSWKTRTTELENTGKKASNREFGINLLKGEELLKRRGRGDWTKLIICESIVWRYVGRALLHGGVLDVKHTSQEGMLGCEQKTKKREHPSNSISRSATH